MPGDRGRPPLAPGDGELAVQLGQRGGLDALQLHPADARDHVPLEHLAIPADGLGLDRHGVVFKPSGEVHLQSDLALPDQLSTLGEVAGFVAGDLRLTLGREAAYPERFAATG